MSSVGVVESDVVRTKVDADEEVFIVEAQSVVHADDAVVFASVLRFELFHDITSDICLSVMLLKSLFGDLFRIFLHFLGHTVIFFNNCFTLRCFLPVCARIYVLTFNFFDCIFLLLNLSISLPQSVIVRGIVPL